MLPSEAHFSNRSIKQALLFLQLLFHQPQECLRPTPEASGQGKNCVSDSVLQAAHSNKSMGLHQQLVSCVVTYCTLQLNHSILFLLIIFELGICFKQVKMLNTHNR